MEIFEVEVGGELYEVEAPDMQAAVTALGGGATQEAALPGLGPDQMQIPRRPENYPWQQQPPEAQPRVPPSPQAPPAPPPDAGVTVAPKGGSPREATEEEARQIEVGAGAGEVGAAALANLGPSAKQFGGDMLHMVLNPVETVETLGKVGAGIAQKLIPGEQGQEAYADAVGGFFAERYGGLDNLKRTMAEDPVGFLADAATVLTGGQLALARAPGVAGQVGRAAGAVSSAIDPVSATVRGAKVAAKGAGLAATELAGLTTGTGGRVVREAVKSGKQGGEAGRAFRDNMRGNVPMDDVITDAKSALSAIRQERSAAYNSGMVDVRADTKVLDFGGVERALANTKSQFSFKSISTNPGATAKLQEVAKILDDWKKLDPAEFHTPSGFDALKQRIGSVLDSIPFEQKVARQAVGQVFGAVKRQVAKQAPGYNKAMRNYERASETIREIERTLSINPRANVDTQLRKLQSVMRDNVNTTYGRRADLVKLLEEHGATHLLGKLAGQAASSYAPRGLARAVAGLQTAGGFGAAFSMLNPATLALLVPSLAVQSPRLVNELAHAMGRATGPASSVPVTPALQAGYLLRGAGQDQ